MRILYLADRLSVRGGADLHLRQVVEWAMSSGHEVRFAVGRIEKGVRPPEDVDVRVIRGLASPTPSTARLSGLDQRLEDADVVHVQSIMNPAALRRACETGRAVFTVQDHRVFCPAMGKTMPDGTPCRLPFERADCGSCLPDDAYRNAMIELTTARRDALRGTHLVVLSSYMKAELDAVGLAGAHVIPPWIAVGPARVEAGGTLLIGGRLVPHKSVLTGYEGWRRAGRPLPLEVAGEGPLAAEMKDAGHRGWLDAVQLHQCLREARALIFTAFWQEPFGIMGVEALAQGTPVLVAAEGGALEWSNRGCLRVRPGDVAGMAAAIRRLADDPEHARDLGEQGRLMVAERFSVDRLAPRLEALYQSVGGRNS